MVSRSRRNLGPGNSIAVFARSMIGCKFDMHVRTVLFSNLYSNAYIRKNLS